MVSYLDMNAQELQQYSSRREELKNKFSETEKLKCIASGKYLLDSNNGILCHEGPGYSFFIYYSFDELLGSSVVIDGETTYETSLSSALGRAAVGSLFGGVGALVGGMTAKRKEKTKIKSVLLRLDFGDKKVDLDFYGSGTFSGYGLASAAEEKANQLHEYLKRFIEARSSRESQSSNGANDLASQLATISGLHKQGVLSDKEFEVAKGKLLSR